MLAKLNLLIRPALTRARTPKPLSLSLSLFPSRRTAHSSYRSYYDPPSTLDTRHSTLDIYQDQDEDASGAHSSR